MRHPYTPADLDMVAFFLQCLNIVRNHSYVMRRELSYHTVLSHKKFTMALHQCMTEPERIADKLRNLILLSDNTVRRHPSGDTEPVAPRMR